MMLEFNDSLIRTNKFDPEAAMLADAHYSRQTVGSPQFMPPGKTIILRDARGQVVFGWVWNIRDDGQAGYNCSIFRNTSPRRSSEIILEAEQVASRAWGVNRGFTYVDPSKVKSTNPGFCFKQAGWSFVKVTQSGLHLLEKAELAS